MNRFLRLSGAQSIGDAVELLSFLKRLEDDTRGATAVEYGLILSLVVIAVVGAIGEVANTTTEMWNDVEERSVEAMKNS
jgi:pilus assembly protein Flp/PilA